MPAAATIGVYGFDSDSFLTAVRDAEVRVVLDVRQRRGVRGPEYAWANSRRLQDALAEAGIGYRWEKRLGGFRKLLPDSPDTALRNDSFRAYAGYMRSEDFLAAAAELAAGSQVARTAIMCSETLWWRCHRRLIADHCVLLAGLPVKHLMPPGKAVPHVPTHGVRVVGDELRYDVPA